jgi:selenium-binding protein 1
MLLQLDTDTQQVGARVAIRQPWLPVTGWALPQLPPLITDILISLDDRWLFYSNWLRGELAAVDCLSLDQQQLRGGGYVGGRFEGQW